MKTVRDIYIALLIELNKHKSPTILLEDFNHYHNKAIQSYTNKRVNIFPVGRQVIDDLAPLVKFSTKLVKVTQIVTYPVSTRYSLPANYFHLLRCNVGMKVVALDRDVCVPIDSILYPTTKPITSKELSDISSDYYLKPSSSNIYYMINQEGLNYKLDIFCGESTTKTISDVYIDYLMKPKVITLVEDDIYIDEDTTDNSEQLEFAEYVNQEIFNELLILVLEKNSDPRLQTAVQINQSIAPPALQTK